MPAAPTNGSLLRRIHRFLRRNNAPVNHRVDNVQMNLPVDPVPRQQLLPTSYELFHGIQVADSAVDAATRGERASAATERIEGAIGVLDSDETWGPLVQKISSFSSLVEGFGEIHPYAKAAANIILSITKPILNQNKRDSAAIGLLEVLRDTYDIITLPGYLHRSAKNHDSRRKVTAILAKQMVDCAEFIRGLFETKSFWGRTIRNVIPGSKIDDEIEVYTATFDRLRKTLQELHVAHISIELEDFHVHVVTSLKSMSNDFTLRELNYVRDAGWDGAQACLPDTRTSILEDIIEWFHTPNGPRTHFVTGVLSSGKSSIAHSSGLYANNLGRLGSFISLDKVVKGPQFIFRTLAHNLAMWNPEFGHALANILDAKKQLIDTKDINVLWDDIIVAPAKQVTFTGPILIVFDSLEASGKLGTLIVDILTTRASDLPVNFRVLIMSRMTPKIARVLENNRSNTSYIDLGQRKHASTTRDDIERYFRHDLLREGDDQDPANASIFRDLVEMSAGSFLWASEVTRDRKEHGSASTLTEWFQSRLSTNFEVVTRILDKVYGQNLAHIDFSIKAVRTRFHNVMAHLFSLHEPIPTRDLTEIYSKSHESEVRDVEYVFDSMSALLSGIGPKFDDYTPVTSIHPSFKNFLTVEASSGRPTRVDPGFAHLSIALGCTMLVHERRNRVAALHAVKVFVRGRASNTEPQQKPALQHLSAVSDFLHSLNVLEETHALMIPHIPQGLVYAVCYWGAHAELTLQRKDLDDHVLSNLQTIVRELLDDSVLLGNCFKFTTMCHLGQSTRTTIEILCSGLLNDSNGELARRVEHVSSIAAEELSLALAEPEDERLLTISFEDYDCE